MALNVKGLEMVTMTILFAMPRKNSTNNSLSLSAIFHDYLYCVSPQSLYHGHIENLFFNYFAELNAELNADFPTLLKTVVSQV